MLFRVAYLHLTVAHSNGDVKVVYVANANISQFVPVTDIANVTRAII